MDSIKSKVIRAPQRTGFKTVTSAALPTGAATYTVANANSGHSDNFKIIVPKGAIITATPIMVTTPFTGGTNYSATTGIPANSFEDDGTSHNGGSATTNGYLAAANATELSAARKFIGAGGGLVAAGFGTQFGNKATYVMTENGEREYSVHLHIIVSGAGASSGGSLMWWVEYMFDPNIVWEQESLA